MAITSEVFGSDFAGVMGSILTPGMQQYTHTQQGFSRGMFDGDSVCLTKPALFGEGVDGVKRLILYEEQVLGVTQQPPVVYEVIEYLEAPPGPVTLHNCWVCRVAGWLGRKSGKSG